VGLRRASAVGTVLLAVLTGCGRGSSSDGPPTVTVEAGSQTVSIKPTQYCLDGDGQRYTEVVPPIVEVSPDSPITFTVPDDVADRGWSVQVFDDQLEEKIGAVDVDKGTVTFDGINSSDVAPPAFYLVVVENKGGACGVFSGAWPVGFIRSGGETSSSDSAGPSGQPSG
jgi:hypothetical protein